MDGSVHSAPAEEGRVRRVDDGVYALVGDGALGQLDDSAAEATRRGSGLLRKERRERAPLDPPAPVFIYRAPRTASLAALATTNLRRRRAGILRGAPV